MSERKVSAARIRADEHQSGFETTVIRMPDGLGFYKMKAGILTLDIVPYTVKKGGRGEKGVVGGNPHAETGWLYYERTFWQYSHIGPEDKKYVCPSKTFGKKDFIAEYIQEKSRDPKTDPQFLKDLAPKERQLFLVCDHDEPEKGLQLLDFSFHKFGKLLDERIKSSSDVEGWDLFYFPDTDGMTLRLTVKDKPPYGLDVIAIDFIPRKKSLPDEIANHSYVLDDLLVCMEYDKLKEAFLGVDGAPATADKKEKTESGRKAKEKPETKSETQPETKPDKKPETKSEPLGETAEALGLSKDMEVMFNGKPHTIARISADGLTLTLMDADDDVVKAAAAVVVIPGKGKKSESKKPKTAEELGLTKDMAVSYKGEPHTIFKIASDGTLLLMDADDNPIKGIDPNDVTVAGKAKSGGKSAPAESAADGDEKPWDADWKDDE